MTKQYFYHTAQGKANVVIDEKIKPLGKFRNEAEAKAACLAHYEKACKAADNFNRPKPVACFM